MDKRDMRLVSLLILIFLIPIAGCATITPEGPKEFNQDSPPEETASVSPTPANTQPGKISSDETPDRTNRIPVSTLPAGLERVETPPAEPVTGEVPADLLEEILADLAQKLGKDRASIDVIRAEAVVWNDGSLGCPKPGEFYIQILVNGYWVVLRLEGLEYDYRASDTGYFFLCEGVGSIPISTPGISPDK